MALEEKPSRAQKLHKGQIEADLLAVLAIPGGRRLVLWLLEQCQYGTSAYFGPGLAEARDFRLGEQNVGHKIVAKLNEIDRAIYPQLLTEEAAADWPADEEEGTDVLDDE